jgi:hypothetical protein
MKYKFSSSDFFWLVLPLMMILTIGFLLPVAPNDYWWYMRVGQETLSIGHVPTVDIISATQHGQPVVYHSWLSSVLFLFIYRAGGIGLTVFVRGVVIALAYAIVWLIARQNGAGPRLTSLIVFIAALATSNNWEVRPQMFSYILFAISLWALYQWQKGEKRYLWILPFASLLWVNLHGSFVMLFLLTGAALVFGAGERKALAIALGVALLVTLLNPRGIGAWQYIITSLTNASNKYSFEWGPPVNKGWQMNLFFAWLLAFIPLAAFSPLKPSRLEWIWLLGFGLLALIGLRYVIWFVFILIVVTASLLADWANARFDRFQRGIPAFDVALGIIFIAMPLALLPGLREKWWPQAPGAFVDTPVAATEWLASHPELPGPLWNEIGFGSYLAFALPSRPVWTHTMFETYPPEHWEDYKAVDAARYDWQTIIDKDGINIMMVSVTGQKELLGALTKSKGWCESYHDKVAAVFFRLESGQTCGGQ